MCTLCHFILVQNNVVFFLMKISVFRALKNNEFYPEKRWMKELKQTFLEKAKHS